MQLKSILLLLLFQRASADERDDSRVMHNMRGSATRSEGDEAIESADVSFRIVGGNFAANGEYPYFVQGNGCGGSLIAPRVVMTAAHCSDSRFGSVRIGSIKKDEDGEVIKVQKQIVHPNYSGQDYDFRLLILEKDSKYSPVKLNSNIALPVVDAVQTVIGMGRTSEGGSSTDKLKEADVDYISNSLCSSQYGGNFKGDIMMCAMVPGGGTDACQGDSGGPIMDKASGKQVGVVSWGSGCARPNAAGVYARISAVYPWIRNQICSNTPNDCPPLEEEEEEEEPEEEAEDDTEDAEEETGDETLRADIRILHDHYADEVGWTLTDIDSGKVYKEQKPGDERRHNHDMMYTTNLPAGNYQLEVTDTFGDGLVEAGSGSQGKIEIFVDGKLMKWQDANYKKEVSLFFSVLREEVITGEIQVQYDNYPEEFEWKLVDFETGDEVDGRYGEVTKTIGRFSLLKIPVAVSAGKAYRLELKDGWGDGLQWKDGYIKVIVYANGESETLVEDTSQFKEKNLVFGVPNDIGRQIREATSNCRDTDKLFEVNDSVGQRSCAWLNENFSKFDYLCDFVSVASVCTRTCKACKAFTGAVQ